MMLRTIVPKEDELHYFDAEAADRLVKFAPKYLEHYEGDFAGKPFTFLPWQIDFIRAFFGWKRRSDGLRRFSEAYILTAKGAGKTPLLAGCGLYAMTADGEAGAHVMSAATDFQQANLSFDAAKKYIAANRTLNHWCDTKQFEIRGPKNSKWTVLSGTAEGRHGFRPSCLLMDEAHEWPNGKLYDNLTANCPKRSQPITWVATNAGGSKSRFAWTLHQRAMNVINTPSLARTTSLLPLVYECPEEITSGDPDAWATEEAAREANPSLGHIVPFHRLAPLIEKARTSPEENGKYRRLYLSQWEGTAAGRWLDMAFFDACVSDEQPPGKAKMWVGLDLSLNDDLSAIGTVAAESADRFFIDARVWTPRETAKRYEDGDGIPYGQWAADGHITLVEEPTISGRVRQEIADEIIRLRWKFDLQAVCYDPCRADEVVATLEAAGIPCVPIIQGFRTSPGCNNFARRMKERGLVISANKVLRYCAENAETVTNSYGEIRIVKPEDRHRQAKKVDAVTALVNAMCEARKFSFPSTDVWKGTACLAR